MIAIGPQLVSDHPSEEDQELLHPVHEIHIVPALDLQTAAMIASLLAQVHQTTDAAHLPLYLEIPNVHLPEHLVPTPAAHRRLSIQADWALCNKHQDLVLHQCHASDHLPQHNLQTVIGILHDQLPENGPHQLAPDHPHEDLLGLDHRLDLEVAETSPHPPHHLLYQCPPIIGQKIILLLLLLLVPVLSFPLLEVHIWVEVVEDLSVKIARVARILPVGEQHQVGRSMTFLHDHRELLNLLLVQHPPLHQYPQALLRLPSQPAPQAVFPPVPVLPLEFHPDPLCSLPPASIAINLSQHQIANVLIPRWQICFRLFQVVGSTQLPLA